MQPFISIFNGRRRELGTDSTEVFAQIWIEALQHLRLFRGARLHVFLAIALHANEEGWAWPSYERLADETGYSRDTVCKALADLCKLSIDGDRVLLRYQPQAEEAGKFESNRYLIFPKAADVEKYEGAGVYHRAGDTGGQFGQDNRVGKTPTRQNPYTENTDTNHSHSSTNMYDDEYEHAESHEAQAQEKPEPESEADAQAIGALLARGWNSGESDAARFVAEVGADVILDMDAKISRNLGAAYVRKNAPTWRISDNGRDAPQASSRRTTTTDGTCPICTQPLARCICDSVPEWAAEKAALQAEGAAH